MAAAAAGGAPRALSQREQDIQMMLAADVHLGTKNCDFQMERYVYKRRSDDALFSRGSTVSAYVDLFFYRDPEEAKELEEEEAVAAPEYGAVAEYGAPPTDNWGDQQWGGEAQPAAVPAATTADWGAAPAPVAAEGWDAAAVPPPAAAPPAAAPLWEEGSAPAPTGWQ
ncbi:hypothetical protein ABZP36_020338 [Zizania latifolia]